MRRLTMATFALTILAPSAWGADLEANKQLYRNYVEEMWNKRNPSAADRFLAADFVEHNANLPPGLAGRKQFVASVLAGFSDYHGEIQEVVAEGNKIVARVEWTGTQDGPFQGRPATGNKLRFSTADFFHVENGKLAEHWDVVDGLSRAIGLGLIRPTDASGRTSRTESAIAPRSELPGLRASQSGKWAACASAGRTLSRGKATARARGRSRPIRVMIAPPRTVGATQALARVRHDRLWPDADIRQELSCRCQSLNRTAFVGVMRILLCHADRDLAPPKSRRPTARST